MSELRFLSKGAQLANYLRAELGAGRWRECMPGRMELAALLGVNARTVEEALRQLEREGVLIAQGAGKRRKIAQAGLEALRQLPSPRLGKRDSGISPVPGRFVQAYPADGAFAPPPTPSPASPPPTPSTSGNCDARGEEPERGQPVRPGLGDVLVAIANAQAYDLSQ